MPDRFPPTRFPDMLAEGTSITSSVLRFNVPTVADVSTGAQTMSVTVFPHVGSSAYTTTSANAAKVVSGLEFELGVPITFERLFDPLRGTGGTGTGAAFTNWSSYRTVACCVRVLNTTSTLNQNGLLGMRLSVPRSGPENVENRSVDAMMSMRDTTVYQASRLPKGGAFRPWQPNNYADLSFFSPNDTNFAPALQVFFLGQADGNCSFEIEVTSVYEFRPQDEFEWLFEQKTAVGSPAKVEAMQSELIQAVGRDPSSPNFYDDLSKVLGDMVDVTGRLAEGSVKRAHRLARGVVGVLGPGSFAG
jgi:hypothetical protein